MEEDAKLRDYVVNTLTKRRMANVFITGGAGTGKTHLLKQFIAKLREEADAAERPMAIGVTASTGIAALGIGGTTIHSWSGVGAGYNTSIDKLRMRKKLVDRWKACEVLIIDEISMIGEKMLARISEIGSVIRNRSEPFGGVRVILCGDFLQLAPVGDTCALESDIWKKLKVEVVHLRYKHRQVDPTFGDILDRVRLGTATHGDIDYLKGASSIRRLPGAVILCALVKRALMFNVQRFEELRQSDPGGREVRYAARRQRVGCEKHFAAEDGEDEDKRTLGEHSETSPFPGVLHLRIGVRVQLLVNLDIEDGLVNGSLGTVVDFIECGDVSDVCTDKNPVAPLVKFDAGAVRLIVPVVCDELGTTIYKDPYVTGSRRQLPLQHAWAMTIHKAQGLTLSAVEIDARGIFAGGQFYVALSRATTLQGVYFTDKYVEKKLVKADGPTSWYGRLR